MICPICGTSLTLRFFPMRKWICPACGHENDPDDVEKEEREE